jgi:hypothetical protein
MKEHERTAFNLINTKNVHEIAEKIPRRHFEDNYCVRSGQTKTKPTRMSAIITLKEPLTIW